MKQLLKRKTLALGLEKVNERYQVHRANQGVGHSIYSNQVNEVNNGHYTRYTGETTSGWHNERCGSRGATQERETDVELDRAVR